VAVTLNARGTSVDSFQIGKSGPTITRSGANLTVGAATLTAGQFIGDLTGNADTATAWETTRTINMTGDVSSDSVNIDGSGNITITSTVVANDSHTHDANNLTGTVLNSGVVTSSLTTVGTLTALQVDNVNINLNTISSTAGTDLFITPLAGQQLILDGTIIIDAGVVTGATSITSTTFVGALTGNASTATALATGRTIGMTGDVVWTSTSFDGSGNVTGTSTIQAKAVDVAMLADGTDGELITWSATGVAATVAVGTATHVLTSNGVGVAPTFQAPSGGAPSGTTTDAIQKWNGSAWEEETGVRVVNNSLRVYDNSGETDYIELSHDDLDASITSVNTANLDITGQTTVRVRGGSGGLVIYNSANTAWMTLTASTGVNSIVATGSILELNANTVRIASGDEFYVRGGGVRFYDSTVLDYIEFIHDGTDQNFNFNGTTRLKVNDVPLFLEERASATTDLATYGQIWIRSDAPNTLMFTDDTGLDNVISGNTTEVDYNYSSATTSTDPGAGSLNFNSVTIGSITTLYIDDLISTGQDYAWALSNLADGDILTIRGSTDAADYIVASVNGTPTDSTGFWTVPLTLIHTGTIFTNGDQIRISIQWFSQGGTGTVTSVSVVSANGFAGSVATATTTPAITLTTSINSPILAGNGTAISAATTTGTGSTAVLSAGPTFTGTPAAPTAAAGTNTTQLATTAFVIAEPANTIAVVDTASTSTFITMTDNATGDEALLTDGNLTYSAASTGTLTTGTFAGALSGNATTATTAAGWTTGRTITLTSDVTGVSAAWDGTGNISFTTTIAAKAVDVAMLADGTDGELITWSATGVAATVAVGTATHVLTSNGVGVAPTFQAPAGGTGTVTSSGTPLNNEVAVFATATDINSDSTFTWDGTTMFATNVTGTNIGGITSTDLLDKSATEIVSGQYSFSSRVDFDNTSFPGFRIDATDPGFELYDNNAAADEKLWRIINQDGDFSIQTRTDADGAGVAPISFQRGTGTAVTSITFSAGSIIAPAVDADFDAITATSYGGVAEQSLLDKNATEVIVGTWTLDGTVSTSDFGTGGRVKDGLDNSQPIGFNTIPVYEIDAVDTFDLAHNGMLWHKDAGAAVTFTCDNDTTIPQGASYMVHNDDTEDLTIAEGTATIEFLSPGAAPVGGNVTVEQGGIVTVYKYSDAIFWVWGAKAAATAANITVADESADPTCFPLFVTAATGDLPPKTGSNLTFNSSTGALSATIIGGITEANLVDKTAVETISAAWTFDDNIFILESASADADVAGDGQLWVRNNAPNDLYFTNDVGVDYPVGYATYRRSSANVIDNINQTLNMTTDTVADAMVGGAWIKTNTTAYTLTLEPSTDTQFPVGSQIAIYNRGTSGTMTVTEGSGTTLWVLDGSSATDAAGSATIAAGGYATLIRESTTIYVLMGAGVTP